jgi:hypothetical protein
MWYVTPWHTDVKYCHWHIRNALRHIRHVLGHIRHALAHIRQELPHTSRTGTHTSRIGAHTSRNGAANVTHCHIRHGLALSRAGTYALHLHTRYKLAHKRHRLSHARHECRIRVHTSLTETGWNIHVTDCLTHPVMCQRCVRDCHRRHIRVEYVICAPHTSQTVP